MRIFLKILILSAITLFALFNYRILSFDKGISKTSMGNQSVVETLSTITGIKKVEYYRMPSAGEPSDNSYRVYIVTNHDAYLLSANKNDIDAFNSLGIFSSNLRPNKVTPIPYYVEIIVGIVILFIPFGKRKNKEEKN